MSDEENYDIPDSDGDGGGGDEEEEYDYGSDYNGSEGGEEDQQSDTEIEIENNYYEADDLRNSDYAKALSMFEKVVKLEEGRADAKWTFKSLQAIVILLFKLNRFDDMVKKYKQLLTHMSTVTRNDCTNAIDSILDSTSSTSDFKILSQMYDITLDALKTNQSDRYPPSPFSSSFS
jgi:COP9 signalosome complex subunit 2